MRLLKGQSSIEFVIVVGIALLISSPFIVAAQNSVININAASQFLETGNSLQEIETNVETLGSKSYPARRVMNFRSPAGVENVYNPQFQNESAVVVEIDNRGELVNRSVILDTKVYIEDKSSLESEGLHEISLKRYENSINVTVVG